MTNKKEGKKIKLKSHGIMRFLIGGLFLYFILSFLWYLFNLPIRNIYIKNNMYLSDGQIIKSAGIKDYPSIFRVSSYSIKKKLKKNPLILDVKINKSIFGRITLDIVENKPLFYNLNNDKLVLEDGKTITYDISFLGLPTLINYVPNQTYEDFIKKLSSIDYDLISLISEIEFAPLNDKTDTDRFLLRMNDDNIVYISLYNIKNLNRYPKISASLDNKKGIIYLDSSNPENIIFKEY